MKIHLDKYDRKILATIVSVVVVITLITIYIFQEVDFSSSYNLAMLLESHLTSSAHNLAVLEMSMPILSSIAYLILIFTGAIYITYLSVRLKLYNQVSRLPMVTFSLVAVAFSAVSQYNLLPAVTLLLSLFSVGKFIAVTEAQSGSFNDSGEFVTSSVSATSKLFEGAFYLGAVALLYPPAIFMVAVIPAVSYCFGRGILDFLVMLIAFAVPIAMELYVRWIFGADILLVVEHYISLLYLNGSLIVSAAQIMEYLNSYAMLLVLLLVMIIFSLMGLIRVQNFTLTARARQGYLFAAIFALFTFGLFALSSFKPEVLVMLSAPITLMVSAALMSLRRWLMAVIITLLTLLTIYIIYLF